MKLKHLVLLSLLPASSALGVNYYVDFSQPPYVGGTPLDGVDGWSQSPANNTPASPLTWVNASPAGGAIGGFYDAPSSVPVTVGRTFTGVDAGPKSISFQGAIGDSTNLFPDRDTFGFTVADGSGDTLLTVSFVPDSQSLDPDADLSSTYTVFYAFGTGGLISSSNAITESGLYNFGLTLDGTGAVFNFGTTSQNFTFAGNPAGLDLNDGTLTLTYNWQSGLGDNFLLFNNISVVPEPSSAALLGLGVLGFFARRRR